MGGAAKAVGTGLGDVFTLGTDRIGGASNPMNRIGNDIGSVLTLGASGQPLTNPINGNPLNPFGSPSSSSSSTSPFVLDPNQVAADTGAITGLGATQGAAQSALGQSQYNQTTQQIPTTVANDIQQENPQIMETLNQNHMLDSSAYPQEIARQQEYLTQNLQMPALQQLQQTQTGALGTTQGAGQAGLGRQLSLEDFVNQANVAKSIGASAAPQVGNGKGQTGTLLSGLGSTAPLFGAMKGIGKGAGAGAGAAGAGGFASALGPATDAALLA